MIVALICLIVFMGALFFLLANGGVNYHQIENDRRRGSRQFWK